MILYRIEKAKYADAAFSGHGAHLTGGRWNFPGYPVAYTSATLSLAVLEILAHTSDRRRLSKIKYMACSAKVPEIEIERIEAGSLPGNWREHDPIPPRLQAIGTDWIKRCRSLILRVPSVVVPTEFNYLINPAHPDFARITILKLQPFKFDSRLAKP
ncbi:MAG: RES family NAD+ phosphorylase [Nitrospinae bacterium]|nr:RES family NAD+ phosphorylase [Nitrospinota bacterium]